MTNIHRKSQDTSKSSSILNIKIKRTEIKKNAHQSERLYNTINNNIQTILSNQSKEKEYIRNIIFNINNWSKDNKSKFITTYEQVYKYMYYGLSYYNKMLNSIISNLFQVPNEKNK